MDNSCGCCRKQMPEGDTWCCEDKCGLLTCPDCRPDDDEGACVICQQEDEDEEDDEDEDERLMCFNCEELTDRDKLRECENAECDTLICRKGDSTFCRTCEADIVFNCAECDTGIIKGGRAHDDCLTHDGTRWWCLGCSAAWERALKEDE